MYVHIAALLTLVAATSCYFDPRDALSRQEVLRWRNLTRLPQSLRPSAYQLKVFPRISDGYFNGSVLINVTCHESTSTVILHAHEVLNIHQVNISIQGQEIELTNVSRNGSDDTMTLMLDNPIQSNAELYMLFSGAITDLRKNYKIRGLFTDKGITSYVATANSPISAREIFPCFDEPSFKASFQLSVARLSNMTSLSVMPIETTKPADEEGYEWDHFFPTMPLSTFSMNFMVHQFNKKKYINVPAKQGNISVCIHYQEQIPGDSYIFIEGSILASLINYLDDYLGIEYSLPKLDIVKLPQLQLMAQGSTLGLITLSNIDANSRRPQLARELANQLLNHMVTPQWWNDFILTDMLGNFLLNYIFDKIQPEGVRYMMDRTILYEYGKYTWYHDQRRWNPYVVWTDEWFLHMLNNSLTGSTVQKGIRNLYTERINTTNTFSGREMWDAINRQARLDGTLADSPTVENIANSWLGRQAPHFPAVTVTRNYEDGSALLEQHLFHGESHNVTEEERDFMWWIPIAYITPDNMDVDSIHPVSWMGERTHNIGNLPDMQSFVIMNPIDAGMFLVNYDQHNWGLISSNLQSSECKIPKVTHKKLLQDALLLTSARELNISTTFNLTLSLCNETDLSVWEPFVISLFFIRNDFELTPIEEKLQAYLRPLLGPTLERSDPTNYIWKIIRLLLTSIGYQPYIDGLSYMNKIIPTFPLLDSDTGLLLYCPEFMKNNSDDWETYVYKLQLFIEAKNFFWKYLSKCPGHLDLIEKILNGVANEGTTWKLSTWNSISSLLTKSRTAHNMTFNFLLENVDQLVEKYRASNKESYMANLVQFVFENIKSEEQFNKKRQESLPLEVRQLLSEPKILERSQARGECRHKTENGSNTDSSDDGTEDRCHGDDDGGGGGDYDYEY